MSTHSAIDQADGQCHQAQVSGEARPHEREAGGGASRRERDSGAGSRRRERERARHRREILEAARRVSARSGWADIAVAEVAREAEFAVGTLYNFFESKEGLLRELEAEVLADVSERALRAMASDGNPVERVTRLISFVAELIVQEGELAELFLDRLMSAAATRSPHVEGNRQALAAYATEVERAFNEGTRAGVFAEIGASDLSAAFHGMVAGMVASSRSERVAPSQDRIEHLAVTLRRVFFEAVRTKPRIRLGSQPV